MKEDVIYHPWCFVSASSECMEGQPGAPRTQMSGCLDFCQAALPDHGLCLSLPLTNVALILGDGEEMEVICQQNWPGVGVGKGIVVLYLPGMMEQEGLEVTPGSPRTKEGTPFLLEKRIITAATENPGVAWLWESSWGEICVQRRLLSENGFVFPRSGVKKGIIIIIQSFSKCQWLPLGWS